MQIEKNKDLLETNNSEVKEVYDVYDIMNILNISKTSAYRLIKSNVFKYVVIGKMFRIPRASFDNWLYQMGAY